MKKRAAHITKEQWITAGYELFAHDGPKGIKVEVIASHVGISKSSFYHHFVDLQLYTDLLFRYHLDRAEIVAAQENASTSIDPGIINVLLENKVDLLFNRQLRIHRDVPKFRRCFEKSNKLAKSALMALWAKETGLSFDSRLVEILFTLATENFYLQITDETLRYEWLSDYFRNLRDLTDEIHRR